MPTSPPGRYNLQPPFPRETSVNDDRGSESPFEAAKAHASLQLPRPFQFYYYYYFFKATLDVLLLRKATIGLQIFSITWENFFSECLSEVTSPFPAFGSCQQAASQNTS